MSKLVKENVLSEFSDAYKAVNGKAPTVVEKGGWYSVDGGKNMRLAKLAEWAEELSAGKASPGKKPVAKAAKTAPKATPAAKAAPKAKPVVKTKPVAKAPSTPSREAVVKVVQSSGGLTAKQLWQQRLEQDRGQCRLPRGFQSAH